MLFRLNGHAPFDVQKYPWTNIAPPDIFTTVVIKLEHQNTNTKYKHITQHRHIYLETAPGHTHITALPHEFNAPLRHYRNKNTPMFLPILIMSAISGCATYTYSNGYYHGTPTVEYHYPPNYYYPHGYGIHDLFNYPIPPIYPRDFYRTHIHLPYQQRPHHDPSRPLPPKQPIKQEQPNHIEMGLRDKQRI
ncbi:hypothetical protein [Xylella fastidiosa]|uniref:hypothetical protein n=1 Tax=Xylella fastidiosa TaxID=2371 RepID=UPI00049A2E77|nr:hypothetical protein [Xylella fastidiosa]AIC13630.1 hypothetical protein P303_03855 [Xylella fastidiosa MUL0034]